MIWPSCLSIPASRIRVTVTEEDRVGAVPEHAEQCLLARAIIRQYGAEKASVLRTGIFIRFKEGIEGTFNHTGDSRDMMNYFDEGRPINLPNAVNLKFEWVPDATVRHIREVSRS